MTGAAMDEVVVAADALRAFVAAVLGAVGVGEEDARIAADVLVAADLRGHESHGVARLESFYVRRIQCGQIDPRARLAVLRERAATLALDAQNGLGQPAAYHAMEMCIARARHAGSCVATIRRSNHYGIAGYYAMMALPHDMIGVSCTNALSLVVPTGGRTAVLGTNPIAVAAPANRQRPFVLDMATSVVPSGKVEVKARRGEPLPLDWAVDAHGRPTTDAQGVLDQLDAGAPGGLLPLGGLDAGHKGYGLATMVDILSGVLAGARAGLAVYGAAHDQGEPADVGHLLAAISLDAFGTAGEFKDAMDAYIEMLHRAPRANGVARIMVAGEPEFESAERRRHAGIPLLESVAISLRALGTELGVAAPF